MKHIRPLREPLEHELALAYHDLGTAAFALVHHGALRDPRLAPRVSRIYELTGALPSRGHVWPGDEVTILPAVAG